MSITTSMWNSLPDHFADGAVPDLPPDEPGVTHEQWSAALDALISGRSLRTLSKVAVVGRSETVEGSGVFVCDCCKTRSPTGRYVYFIVQPGNPACGAEGLISVECMNP